MVIKPRDESPSKMLFQQYLLQIVFLCIVALHHLTSVFGKLDETCQRSRKGIHIIHGTFFESSCAVHSSGIFEGDNN